MRFHLLLAAIVVLRCRPSGAADDQAAAVIGRFLNAMGGKEALAAIEDRTHKFENTKIEPPADSVARLSQYLKKGFKVREEWDIQGVQIKGNPLAFTQGYDGRRGWVLMFGSISPMEGRSLSLFVWDKFLDDPLCHWVEDGYRATLLGKDTVEDEPVEVIELTDFTGAMKEKYSFSSRSGLLLKKEWRKPPSEDTSAGKKSERTPDPQKAVLKAILYKKYTSIPFADGSGHKIQFPVYQEIYEDGELDTKREFKEVKINTGLADDLFERPSAQPGQEPPKEFPQPSYTGQVKASHILVGSSAEAEAVRKDVLEKGGTLEAFMDAAHRHSKDAWTKRAAGALGWFTRMNMVHEISEAAFALKPGEISKPIKTSYGWHLIFLEANGEQARPAKRF